MDNQIKKTDKTIRLKCPKIHPYIQKKHAKWVYKHDFEIFHTTTDSSEYKEYKPTYELKEYNLFHGWIITVNNELAGSCLYSIEKEGTAIERPYWYFAYLGILPKYQKCGFGSKLLKKLLDHADQYRARLDCDTDNTNHIAINLYKKHDFVVSETGPLIVFTRRPRPQKYLTQKDEQKEKV